MGTKERRERERLETRDKILEAAREMFATQGIEATTMRAIAGRIGFEVMRSAPTGHPIRLVTIMLELYKGPSPYGQFFQEDISYVGAGIHFSL